MSTKTITPVVTPDTTTEVDVDLEKTPPCEFNGWKFDFRFFVASIPHWGCRQPVAWRIRCECSSFLGCNKHVLQGHNWCTNCNTELVVSRWVKV